MLQLYESHAIFVEDHKTHTMERGKVRENGEISRDKKTRKGRNREERRQGQGKHSGSGALAIRTSE